MDLNFQFAALGTTSAEMPCATTALQSIFEYEQRSGGRQGKARLCRARATLANLDEATQEHGLATPVVIKSTTGIAGLTLGGGFGWLTRKYGMTIDNLISVDVVTADSKKIRASENDNPDLFWAIRVAAEIWRRYPVRIPTFPCGSGNRRWVD